MKQLWIEIKTKLGRIGGTTKKREENLADQEEHLHIAHVRVACLQHQTDKESVVQHFICKGKVYLQEFISFLLCFPIATVLHSNIQSLYRLGKNPTTENFIVMYHGTLEIHVPIYLKLCC